MARGINAHASDDIWHLSIEDLFGPPSEPPRPTGPGPFVINLRTSTATIGSPPKELLRLHRLHVYELARNHEGRPEFRLRLGMIESELEADAILSKVREHYPAAITEVAEDGDRAAIAGAVRHAESLKPASPVTDAKAPVVQEPPKIAATSAPPAAVKSAADYRWDIDEVLPDLAAAHPPQREQEPPNRTSTEGPREPTSALAAPTPSAEAQVPQHTAAAPRARPSTKSRPTPPQETRDFQASRGAAKSPPIERRETRSGAPNRVPGEPRTPMGAGRPVAKTTQPRVDVLRPPSQAKGTPARAAVEKIDSDPNAVTDQVEVLKQNDAASEALRAGTANSTEFSMELTILEVPTLEPARPESELRRIHPPASTAPEPGIGAGSRTVDSVRADHPAAAGSPAPTADADANPPARSGEDSGTLERLVTRIGALVDYAEMHEKSVNAPVPVAPTAACPELVAAEAARTVSLSGVPQSATAQAGIPSMDSTQTVRALTPLELADGEASRWFAIQLMLCEERIDAEQVPNLDIFNEYRLYSVMGLDQDRVMHALRVGFFSSALAAEAVAGYLAAYFDTRVIKRVSIAECERFADRRVAAGKDVGATGVHAVIEVVVPAPLPERRRVASPLSDTGKRPVLDETSLWSRLLAPRNR